MKRRTLTVAEGDEVNIYNTLDCKVFHFRRHSIFNRRVSRIMSKYTKKELGAHVYGVLAALGELKDAGIDPVPESSIYLAMQMDMDLYALVKSALVGIGYATISHNGITITESGKKAADIINTELGPG